MNDSKISTRYALALFLEAREKKLLDRVRSDLDRVTNTIREVQLLKEMLASPIIPPGRKRKAVKEVFRDVLHPLSLQFFDMVLENKREEFLAGMIRAYMKNYMEDKGIRMASLKTAIPLSEDLKNELTGLIREVYETEIELSAEVDKQIIGGYILRVDDIQMDASVAGQLGRIRRQLAKEDHEPN